MVKNINLSGFLNMVNNLIINREDGKLQIRDHGNYRGIIILSPSYLMVFHCPQHV